MSVNKLIDEEDGAPEIVTPSVIKAIIDNSSIPRSLIQHMNASFGMIVKQFYNKGKNYKHIGLPNSTKWANPDNSHHIINILTELHNEEPTLISTVIDATDADFIAMAHMTEHLGYVQETNEVKYPGIDVGYPLYYLEAEIKERRLNIVYTNEAGDEDKEVNKEYIQTSINLNTPMYMVMYTLPSGPGINRYWWYDIDSQEHPELYLNSAIDYATADYLPIIPIRVNKKNVVNSDESLKNQVSRTLAEVSVDLEEFTEALMTNPDVSKVDDVFILFGVNPTSEVEAVGKYFYHFIESRLWPLVDTPENLEKLESLMKASSYYDPAEEHLGISGNTAAFMDAYLNPSYNPPQDSIKIDDGQFNLTVRWARLNRIEHTGSIGKVGTYAKVHDGTEEGEFNYAGSELAYLYPFGTLRVMKQIDEDTFIEYQVFGLATYTHIHRKTSATRRTMKDEDIFLPLDYDVISSLNAIDEHNIYYDSFLAVTYTWYSVRTKWYQKKWFKIVLIIIIIVLIVLQMHALAKEMAAAYSTAIAAGGTMTAGALAAAQVLALAALETIVATMIIKEVAVIIAEKVGGELGLFVAVVVAAVASYKTNKFFNTKLSTVTQLLVATTVGLQAGSQYIVENIEDITDRIIDLQNDYEERLEEFDAVEEELFSTDDDYNIADFMLNRATFLSNEHPTDYYTRTIHTGNPGVASLRQIASYVDYALELPMLGSRSQFAEVIV